MKRPTLDEYYIEIAKAVSLRSICEKNIMVLLLLKTVLF